MESQLHTLFQPLVADLALKLDTDLGYDLQEHGSPSLVKCMAHELRPTLGVLGIQFLIFIAVCADRQEASAVVLPFSQSARISRQHTREDAFLRFICPFVEYPNWKFVGWTGDEHGEFESWTSPD